MSIVMTLLGMIPGLSNLIQFVYGKWRDSKVAMYQTRWGVTKEVAISAIQAEVENNRTKVGWLHEVANSRFLQCLVGGFAFPLIVHMNKAYVWDNIVHKFIWGTYGYTPPLTGYIVDWGGHIVTGIFVTGTGMGLAGAIAKRASKE
jgi:hypothetical protein